MNAVFIGPHPDDIEYGCAGTIRRLIKTGTKVYWILLTNGENDSLHTGEMRICEMNASADFLGVERLILLNLPDGNIACDPGVITRIRKMLEHLQPDFVFAPYCDDRHQDHRNTFYIVRSAIWGQYDFYAYPCFSSMNFSPTLFVDISDEIEIKKNAIALHVSQTAKYKQRGIDFVEDAICNDRKNGSRINSLYAEGFIPVNCKLRL